MDMLKKSLSILICIAALQSLCFGADKPTVRFDTAGGSPVPALSVNSGDLLAAPAHPVRDGWVFAGWYTDPKAELRMWDFRNDSVSGNMTLYAKWLQLDSKHLLLNAYATPEELESPYVAATLQTLGELSADGHSLTLPEGTVVYIAPGVYWTDPTYRKGFPFDDSGFVIAPPNVGLRLLGDNLSFIGLTADPEDVRICGNRGEGGAKGLGAGGSWYTIAVPTGFRCENITIANYAQEDLVYPRDPSQNISKRIDSKNHAEVMQSSTRNVDRMYFRNVRFTGYLNMMAGFSPQRAYFKDCFFQCTDDSVFGGHINVYENCTFHNFGDHPVWSAAGPEGINAVLGCTFVGMPQMTLPTLYFAKMAAPGNGASATSIYAVIDSKFLGRIEAVEWENKVREDARYAVSNNTIGTEGRPLVISPAHPQTSVEYSGRALEAFKVGDRYNIYNLLKGDDGWDPAGQNSAAWAPYANLPYRFLVGYTGKELHSDRNGEGNSLVLTAAPTPASSVDISTVVWKYDDALLEGTADPSTGKLTVAAKPNRTGAVIETPVECALPSGVTAGVTLKIWPVPVAAPVLKSPSIKIGGGSAVLSYKLDKPSYRDVSVIDWYRESAPGRTDGVHIGTSRNDPAGFFVDDPLKDYRLSKYDVGCYLRAVITPAYEFGSVPAAPVTVYSSRAISAKDVKDAALQTDFRHLYITREDKGAAVGRWFFDCDGETVDPWGWGIGSNGSEGLWGLMNNTRSQVPSRMVFGQKGQYGDMSLTLNYSSGKVEGQGFGGSGCYLDVYIKYDPVSHSGYGLRVERVPASSNATEWTLCRFEGDSAVPLTKGVLTASFMPQSTLCVSVEGNTLKVTASTASAITPLQSQQGLSQTTDISWTDPTGALAGCRNGGFGFYIFNSGNSSYSFTAGTNNCVMLHDVRVESEEID